MLLMDQTPEGISNCSFNCKVVIVFLRCFIVYTASFLFHVKEFYMVIYVSFSKSQKLMVFCV